MSEQDRIMCASISFPASVPSVETTCGDCGEKLWVSNTMAPRVTSGELSPVCELCALTISAKGFRVAPEQRPEFERLGILEWVDQYTEMLNETHAQQEESLPRECKEPEGP